MAIINLLTGICLVILFLGLIIVTPPIRNFLTKHLGLLVLLTYLAGFLVYMYGFWHGALSNVLTSAMLASTASVEMFAFHSSLVEVSEELKEGNVLYMIVFSLVHFLALVLTIVFLLDVFGKRFTSRLEAWYMTHRPSSKKLMIIDGTDENCIALAKSVPPGSDTEIVFIRGVLTANVGHFSLAEIVLSGMKKNRKKDLATEYGRVITCNLQLAVSLTTDKGWIGARAIKLIKAYKAAEIYFPAWDSELNADAAYRLSQSLPEGLDVTIHAGVNSSKVHAARLANCQYVVPSNRSDLVVKDLLENTPLLSNPARTLIIGFGHTAESCVESLFDKGFTQVDIADPKVNTESEEFLCFHPSLRGAEGLQFYGCDAKSNDFWKYLRENISGLSNVIVFDQDDTRSLNTAIKVLRYAQSVRDDMSGFNVYVMERESQLGDDSPNIFTFGKREAVYNVNLL